MEDQHLRLGVLYLPLSGLTPIPGPSTSTGTGCSRNWWPLESLLDLHSVTPIFAPTSSWSPTPTREVIEIIKQVIGDPGLGVRGTYSLVGNEAVVRCELVPSDGMGSLWRRTGTKVRDRSKWLKELFWNLRTGWHDGEESSRGDWLMARTEEDSMRMSDLYSSIPSPRRPDFERAASLGDAVMHRRLENYDDLPGLKTTMYKYQARSVAKMFQMETEPDRLVDPLFTRFNQPGAGGVYYVNLATWDIQRHPGWYDLPRGGILCEQMGVGKTLMCLSLILSTIHQPCSPPPHALNTSPTMTENMERTYPFPTYNRHRQAIAYPLSRTSLALPSLVDICANRLAIYDQSADAFSVPLNLKKTLQRPTFYYEYPPDVDCMREARKKTLDDAWHKKIWLAKSTLVVVPGILVKQWKAEIEKHVEYQALTVYVAGKESLDIETLIQYDVILMDVARFAMEETFRRSRLNLGPSVLLDARWKRLILDEGHVAGSKVSNAMRLATSLSVERRWAVSGTPTKHLQQGGEGRAVGQPASQLPQEGRTDQSSPLPTQWNRNDLDDASRIGVMIGGFLAAEPFRSDAAFQERVTGPLRAQGGPPFGAVRRLKSLMDAIMVKHRPHEIDSEASLPPSTISTVVLQFEPMQRLTYNAITALIVGNAYASNFEDEDYFLHPKNIKEFNNVIENLHLACFWYSSNSMDIEGCLARMENDLATKPDLSEAGRIQLTEAAQHLRKALATPGWLEWMTNGVSLPFLADNFPPLVQTAWSDSMDEKPSEIDTYSLLQLKRMNLPGTSLHQLHIAGWDSRAVKHEEELGNWKKQHDMEERRQNKTSTEASRRALAHAEQTTAARKPPSIKIRRLSQKKKHDKGDASPLPLANASARRKVEDEVDFRILEATANARAAEAEVQAIRAEEMALATSLLPRPLPMMLHTKSRSAKLNHVIRSIMASDPADKFVIFGDTYQLGHLTEALDLMDITSCFIGVTWSNATERYDALTRFEDPTVKVCLMDARVAARGLNLIVANRMILLSPMWNLDTQAQAVKRIHRIGQTRETKIEILVTEGTFEEEIANRASTARSETEEKLYSKAMIENPRFVYTEKEVDADIPVHLIPAPVPVPAPARLVPVPVSPLRSSPDTDTTLVTPLDFSNGYQVSDPVSPTLQHSREAPMSLEEETPVIGDSLKRHIPDAAPDTKPKKRVRIVAFA